MIGGAGRVASLVVPRLAREHHVTVADRQPADWWDGDFVRIDLLDHDRLPGLFESQDALVFMAMGPKEGWGSTEWARQHFDVNVTGPYLAMQAAGRAGVRRQLRFAIRPRASSQSAALPVPSSCAIARPTAAARST